MPWYRRSGIGARLTVLCCLLAMACGREQPDSALHAAATPVRRDSAGVTILEYPAGVAQHVPQWVVDTEPLAVIGDDPDGSDDVTRVFGAVLLSDGAVAFWDDARGQVAAYEPDGTLRRRIGRRGRGPDDFGGVSGLSSAGDTLIVPDDINDRTTLYDPALTKLSLEPGPRHCEPVLILGRFPDGRLLGDVSAFAQNDLARTDTTIRLPRPLLLISQSRCDTVRLVPGHEMRVIETRYGGYRSTHEAIVRFGRHTSTALWNGTIATGTAQTYRIDVLSEHGQLLRSMRIPSSSRPIPSGLRDSIIRHDLQQLKGYRTERMVDPAESERLVREATFVADSLAPYSDMMVGTDGLLWVVDGWAPDLSERSALAFSRSGTIEAHLTMPARYRPMAFGSDRVLTRVEDPESGVVTFRVLRMHGADR
jgi:hypothetical protein